MRRKREDRFVRTALDASMTQTLAKEWAGAVYLFAAVLGRPDRDVTWTES